MESGAKGREVIVSGKLRAARARSMKFKDGYMVSSGQPTKDYIDYAVKHVLLKQNQMLEESQSTKYLSYHTKFDKWVEKGAASAIAPSLKILDFSLWSHIISSTH
ncbi:unnamed protein product [Brassica oleracea]